MEPVRNAVEAEEIDEVEVQQEEAVAALAEQLDGLPREDGGDEVLSAEADDQRAEERDQEASVHEDVGDVLNGAGEEESDGGERGGGDQSALAAGESEYGVQLAQRDAGEEGADVGQRGVFEGADPEAVAVAGRRGRGDGQDW